MSDWPNDWKPGDPPPPGYLISKKGRLYRVPNPPHITPQDEENARKMTRSVFHNLPGSKFCAYELERAEAIVRARQAEIATGKKRQNVIDGLLKDATRKAAR
jgi:hypothetical protein